MVLYCTHARYIQWANIGTRVSMYMLAVLQNLLGFRDWRCPRGDSLPTQPSLGSDTVVTPVEGGGNSTAERSGRPAPSETQRTRLAKPPSRLGHYDCCRASANGLCIINGPRATASHRSPTIQRTTRTGAPETSRLTESRATRTYVHTDRRNADVPAFS